REAGRAEVAPVVKADAYGLGLGPVARRLWSEGARRFFTARLSEGVALRAALGPARPAAICVLDGCTDDDAPHMVAHELTPVLNSLPQVREWTAHARTLGRTLSGVLHVDTGLNRLGLRPEEARALSQTSDGLRGVELEVVMSHLACADPEVAAMDVEQAARFEAITALFPQARTSLGASAGLFLGPRFRGQVVRPGIALYGGGPFQMPDSRLRPVATLDAPILQVRSVAPGESVGYGAAYRAERALRVAVVGLGYADGVLRASERPRYGWFAGAKRAVLGRISMDLIALDVTGCEAWPGARVELFGPNLPVDEAAADAGTIAFELLSNVAPRVQRVHLGAQG
ncbi:alanine racemase, partial [Caulobacter sp. S45]|uniref:alanine racemase n=1 Tax=Caulobacter sp. S45 TaxID=1641861 RepID=UPI0015765AD4